MLRGACSWQFDRMSCVTERWSGRWPGTCLLLTPLLPSCRSYRLDHSQQRHAQHHVVSSGGQGFDHVLCESRLQQWFFASKPCYSGGSSRCVSTSPQKAKLFAKPKKKLCYTDLDCDTEQKSAPEGSIEKTSHGFLDFAGSALKL